MEEEFVGHCGKVNFAALKRTNKMEEEFVKDCLNFLVTVILLILALLELMLYGSCYMLLLTFFIICLMIILK